MIYRLRHVPTGKYFKSGANGKKLNNLDSVGKLYNYGKPQWDWVQWIYVDGQRTETQKSDWEVVSYELTEVSADKFE